MAWTVEEHLSGKEPAVRQMYEAFDRLIAVCGPAERTVTKTAIVFKGVVRGFAGVTPRQRTLTGFLDLMERVQEKPFTRASRYTQRLWVNRFVVGSVDELDDRFAARVAQAYAVGGGVHRK